MLKTSAFSCVFQSGAPLPAESGSWGVCRSCQNSTSTPRSTENISYLLQGEAAFLGCERAVCMETHWQSFSALFWKLVCLLKARMECAEAPAQQVRIQRWGPCSEPPRGRALGNLKGRARFTFLLQGEPPSWQGFGCTSTGIFAVHTRRKHWESLVLPQHRAQSLKTAALEKVSPRSHTTKWKWNEKLQLPMQKGKASLPHTLSFDIIIPHQRKYFGITILHIYISEIKHLLSTLLKLYWGQILLSRIPTHCGELSD